MDPMSEFVTRMDAAVARWDEPGVLAQAAATSLPTLLDHPECLSPAYRESGDDSYRQHVVHVHPQGRYSLVALVWRPGQATPIHDHRCWCVVGVLQGREAESRYQLFDHHGESLLAAGGQEQYGPGSICTLVPPQEDIHRVSSAAEDELTISLHVYGADIARLGTSINHVFDPDLVREHACKGQPLSWRSHR